MILDQFGRPVNKTKAPVKRTLAAAPVTESYREYAASGLTPQRLASIFKGADGGDVRLQAELFSQIEERDGHLLGEKGKRQNAILDVPFAVTPASDDGRDVKVAEFVENFLEGQTDFEDVLTALQDAVGKGYSSLEIGWDVSEGQAVPDRFEFIPQHRFYFADPKGYLSKTPRLITDQNTMGEEIPPWQVLFHRYGGKSGHPARSGLYRVCAWMFLFKNYAIKDWVIFCEVYGMPLRVGKYDPGATQDDKDALIAAISALGADAAAIISKSTEIEFVEAASKGGTASDLYERLAKFSNAEMSKALLGQTLTAEVGETGSYAASKTHNEVRMDLAKSDTRAAASTLRNQLIRPMVGFNFGWDTPCPGYAPVWEESEDLKAKSDWVCALLDRGMEMPISFIRSEFNIPEPGKDEAVLKKLPGFDQGRFAKLRTVRAKGNPATAMVDSEVEEAVLARLETEAAGLMDGLIDPVKRLIASAKNFDEIRDGLLAVYPEKTLSELGDLMARAFAVAEIAGRFDAAEGS